MSSDVLYSTVEFSQKNHGKRAADKTSAEKQDDVTYAAVKFGEAPSRQQQQAASSSTAVYNLQTKNLQLQSQCSELERNYTDISANSPQMALCVRGLRTSDGKQNHGEYQKSGKLIIGQ
ncbi:UNVERIFIED_CONTAM: hypothetical protein FKN15_065197 [Acipenser sinensis]